MEKYLYNRVKRNDKCNSKWSIKSFSNTDLVIYQ